MKLSHVKLILISGLVWFGIGIYLLQLGFNLLLEGAHNPIYIDQYPLLKALAPYTGSFEAAIILLVVIALLIGYYKGRYVLGKSARRGVNRILTFSNPAPFHYIYSAKYYILLGSMVALGISIKFMGLSHDVRGLIDTIIGSALINGSMIYFRLAQSLRTSHL